MSFKIKYNTKENNSMKKNTLKKIMSAVLSVAMLVSVMALPANAIVPGEDAYNGSNT